MRKSFIIILLSLLLAPVNVCAIYEYKEYVLIVHPENPIVSVDLDFIEQVFLVEQTSWPNGKPIDVVLNKSRCTAEKFYKDVIRKTSGQYLTYRKKLLFNGLAIPPMGIGKDEAVIRYVSQHVNSISFVSRDSFDSRVKALAIQELAAQQ